MAHKTGGVSQLTAKYRSEQNKLLLQDAVNSGYRLSLIYLTVFSVPNHFFRNGLQFCSSS